MVPGAAATRLLKVLSDGQEHTLDGIEYVTIFSRRQISDAAALLRRRGYLAATKTGIYQLSEGGSAAVKNNVPITSGPIGPTGVVRTISNTFKERAWRAMRMRRQFSLNDIVGDAKQDEANPRNNLSRFMRALIKAGYVREMVRRQRGTRLNSNGFKRYELIKDTGPRAPVYSHARRALRDENLGKDIPCVAN